MTPVIYLSDAFLATGLGAVAHPGPGRPARHLRRQRHRPGNASGPTSATRRRWRARGPSPARPGLEHRIGGLEKADGLGTISYDPENHHRMTELRAQKVAGIADDIPDLEVYGPERGDLLMLGWGCTYGSIRTAVERLQRQGHVGRPRAPALPQPVPAQHRGRARRPIAACSSRRSTLGQLRLLIRGRYLVDAVGLNRVRGKPFPVPEVEQAARLLLDGAMPSDDRDDDPAGTAHRRRVERRPPRSRSS